MNKLNIGETILRLRKAKNITQEQLAFMGGVSPDMITMITSIFRILD